MFKCESVFSVVTVVVTILFNAHFVQGTCNYFYHYVPLASGHSPPCDPTGINIALHCSGYSPPTASVDLVWMWSPDGATPYTEASFFTHFNWSPSSSTSTPTSGPYAGYNHHQNELTFAGTGLISDIMGYYACTFVHRGASTTPEFDLTPSILLTTTAGAPCPAYSGFSFAEYFTPDICAESAQSLTTTLADSTESSTSEVTESPDEQGCCRLQVYLGLAAALITATCVFTLGLVAFFVARAVKSVYRRKRRKIYVDGNVIDPRTNEEHNLKLHGCQVCDRMCEDNN